MSGFIGMTIALKTPLPLDLQILREKIQSFKQTSYQSLFASKFDQPVNILVMGIDRVSSDNPELKFSGRSDTMLLVRLDADHSKVKVLSIPRDTRVKIPNSGYGKINQANAQGGIPLTKTVIAQNLNGITIDQYVRVTSDAFRRLVDSVGGIVVYVPQDMQYSDKTQGLEIDLKKGRQRLDGDQAEQFVRFRSDGLGDIGRIQRQQIALKALKQRLQSPQIIWRAPRIWQVLADEIDTDLSNEELINLATFSLGLKKEDLQMLMLPGRASNSGEYQLSYWLTSKNKTNKIIQDYLNTSSSGDDRINYRSRIAIQNGTQNPELARQVALFLVQQGYQNVYLSDRDLPRMRYSQIIVQQGDANSAKQVLEALKFGELEYSSTGELNSDLTIVLGQDAQIRLSSGRLGK